MSSRPATSRSNKSVAPSKKPIRIKSVVHINDFRGALHVVAQDANGECWYFSENGYGMLCFVGSIGKPDGVQAGPIALVEDSDGALLAFAVGVRGSAWMNWYSRSKWHGWISVGNTAITHLGGVAQQRGVLLVARTSKGNLDGLKIGVPRSSKEWSNIAKSCAGQPLVLLAPRGDVVVLFRSDSGQLMEIQQTMAMHMSLRYIDAPPLVADPCAALSPDGHVLVIAPTVRGLIAKQTDGGSWQAANAFEGSSMKAREPRLLMLDKDTAVLTARSADGSFLTKTAWTTWSDTGAVEPDLSSLVRLSSGRVDILSPSWLAAAISGAVLKWSAFTLTIQTITPVPPLFEGDEVEVTYTLTNSSPKAATGETTASISSNSPTWYSYKLKTSGPSPTGLAVGASIQSSFILGNYQYLAAGLAHISVRYISYQTPPKIVRMSFYGPGLGPEVAIGGVIDYIAADSRQEKVWQFEEAFPTDDSPVIPGPTQCSINTPDLTAPIHSYNFLTLCRTVQGIDEPHTINEVAAIVAAAGIAGTRLRVIGSQHSANSQLCTEGRAIQTTGLQGAAPANSGMSLLSQPPFDFDADLSWPTGADGPLNPPRLVSFEGDMTVQVGPGMKTRDLNNWLDSNGWSLGFAVPGFREPTIGGAIATGTHGSSIIHSVVLSSRVKWLLLIRADGAIVEYSESTTDSDTWKALRCNLGFLGVVVQIRLKVEPSFNLRVKIQWTTADTLLNAANPQDLVTGADYGQMVWFPRGGDADAPVVIFRGHRTTDDADLSVENRLLHPTIPVAESTLAQWVIDGMESSVCSGDDSRGWEILRSDVLKYVYSPYSTADQIRGILKLLEGVPPAITAGLSGPLLAIPGVFPIVGPLLPILPIIAAATGPCEPEVVGRWHRMMSSELAEIRPMQRDWEIFIPQTQAKAALNAASQFFKANYIHLPLIGIFLRFAPAEDTTLLAHTVALPGSTVAGEPGMFFEMPVLLPTKMKCSDRDRYEQLYADFVETLIKNFGGRAHWGKNRSSAFQLQRKRGVYGFNLTRFRRVVKRMDPKGMFANQYGVDLGLRWPASPPVPNNTETRGCIPG